MYLVTILKDLETDLLYKAEVPSKDLLHHNLQLRIHVRTTNFN